MSLMLIFAIFIRDVNIVIDAFAMEHLVVLILDGVHEGLEPFLVD